MENLSLSGVKSLFQSSVVKVVENLPDHLDDISNLPTNVKDKIVYLMSKRGLISDDNINQVIHPKLRQLDLSDCDNVGDAGLRVIAATCKQLQKIDLNCSKGFRNSITSQGVISLAQSCQYLQVVYLRRCSNITDTAIIELSQRCPRLRDLNIGYCSQITDLSLQALGQNCTMLRSVNFAHSKVTDEGVFCLVSGNCSASLNEIHMNHCVELTDEAVEAVVQFCQNITIFIFSGCPHITDQSRVALEEILGHKSKIKQLTWTIY